MKRLAALLFLCAIGCAQTAVRVEPAPLPDDYECVSAEWHHGIDVTQFADYAPDEFLVMSWIADPTPTVRYEVPIRVPSLGVKYVATQGDGSETETFEICLREGDTPESLYADFDHSVRRHGQLKLRFCGTTVLPRP